MLNMAPFYGKDSTFSEKYQVTKWCWPLFLLDDGSGWRRCWVSCLSQQHVNSCMKLFTKSGSLGDSVHVEVQCRCHSHPNRNKSVVCQEEGFQGFLANYQQMFSQTVLVLSPLTLSWAEDLAFAAEKSTLPAIPILQLKRVNMCRGPSSLISTSWEQKSTV